MGIIVSTRRQLWTVRYKHGCFISFLGLEVLPTNSVSIFIISR